MIDYETYCKIMRMRQDNLRVSQISATLGLDERTVLRWMEEGSYRQRKAAVRPSKLDPYKPRTSCNGWRPTRTAAYSYCSVSRKTATRVASRS